MTLSIDSIDERRERISRLTPTERKSELGQFMTPSVIGRFMSSMFRPMKGRSVRVLDPGSGIGSLTTEFVRRGVEDGVTSFDCELWELDDSLIPDLKETLLGCRDLCDSRGVEFTSRVRHDDFILCLSNPTSLKGVRRFTHSILNPPYKKIGNSSEYRTVLNSIGIDSSNLYSGFVSLGIHLLESGGEMVFITPRSFCNGPYFRPFRKLILRETSITKVHLFHSRTNSFKSDEVLQENVIFHLVKGETQGDIVLSTSTDSTFSDLSQKTISFSDFCSTSDPDSVFHFVTDDDSEMERLMKVYSNTLQDIGLGVSTGPVVDFRLRSSLRDREGTEIVPLLYPFHFNGRLVRHPVTNPKRPQYIKSTKESERWLTPRGTYVLVRRLSSKEEKRRVISGLLLKSHIKTEMIGIENHLNYFHEQKRGMTDRLGRGLTIYLSSSFVDRWIRRFSGHTQVNSTDLRSLGYPSRDVLNRWGERGSIRSLSQDDIDSLVEGERS